MIGTKLPKRVEFWVCPDKIPQTQWNVWRVVDDRGIGRKGNTIVATFPDTDEGYNAAHARATAEKNRHDKIMAVVCF